MRSHRVGAGLAAAIAIVVGTLSCGGPGSVANAVRPKASTANEALGETDEAVCRDVSKGARPLVVDWKPEQRADLEVTMRDGIAVVAYDCQRFELLADCRAEGTYGFKGVVLKQQIIRLQDADEIRANLPLSGALLAARLEGELKRGTSLDLAIALVGNQTSTRMSVARPELTGRCDGATHFVRGANVGAFVLETGEKAKVASSAELLGAGASAASQSNKSVRNEDGSVSACKQSTTEATQPPQTCGAVVRLHLVPLDKADSASVAQVTGLASDDAEGACPEGLVLSEGKCAQAKTVERHVCSSDDATECGSQCDREEPVSCSRLARLHLGGNGVSKDTKKAAELFDKSCKLEHAGGCSNLAMMYAKGEGVERDELRAAALFDSACKAGEPVACFNLGTLYELGRGVTKDVSKATALFRQSCDAGNAEGCINLGSAYDDGVGVEKDSKRAFALFKRACEGKKAQGCTNLGFMYSSGSGVPEEQALASRYYQMGCELGSMQGCEYVGNRYLTGKGIAKDVARGKELLKRACDDGRTKACKALESAE